VQQNETSSAPKVVLSVAGTATASGLSKADATSAGKSTTWRVPAYRSDKKGTGDQRRKGEEKAVYAYIQARRALGEVALNTVEIADALAIPVREVEAIVAKLADRGVRVWK